MIKPFNKYIFILKLLFSTVFILGAVEIMHFIRTLGATSEGVHYEALAYLFMFIIFAGIAFWSTLSLVAYFFRYLRIKQQDKKFSNKI